MRANTSSIRAIAAAFVLLLTTAASRAVLLDWAALPSGQSWTQGALTGSFNLDGVAGNDIQISIVSSGVTFASDATGTYPQNIADAAINSSVKGLQLWTSAGMTNSTNKVTVTISFLGTYATGTPVSLTLFDVDATSTSFIDKISVTAVNGATPVNLTATFAGTGTQSNTITGSGGANPIITGLTSVGNISNSQGNVLISSGTASVTSITFVWNNPGPNFGGQAIDLGNINFAPEVGSSTVALALCAGLLIFGRRRRSAARLAACSAA